jgi:hypothetical protein
MNFAKMQQKTFSHQSNTRIFLNDLKTGTRTEASQRCHKLHATLAYTSIFLNSLKKTVEV